MLATIPEWWARRAHQAGLRQEWLDWRRALPPFPEGITGQPLVHLYDADSAEIGRTYVHLSEPTVRARDGRHYTPASLADYLWDEIRRAAPEEKGTVVDPACGAGALLLPGLRAWLREHSAEPDLLDKVTAQFAGTDIDKDAVWLGNALLAAEMLPYWASMPSPHRGRPPQLLRVGDGLAPARDEPDLIVMNPPFGRVRLTAEERVQWERSLYGHSNRYALFLHAAIGRVRCGGLVAAVLPASFLGGSYYQSLRQLIAEEAPLQRLVFIDQRAGVFAGDVLQETCLAIFRKGGRVRPIACSRIQANGAAEKLWSLQAPQPQPPFGRPWPLPRTKTDAGLVTRVANLTRRLPGYGWKASTGPLVWNRHKPQISDRQGPGSVPILWAADIDGGRIQRDPVRDPQRWFRVREVDRHMLLEEPAVLVQRTTAPEQPRRLVAASLTEDVLHQWGGVVVVENHVNVLWRTGESALTPEVLGRLLATATFDRLYRSLSGSVAVSAYELESLPLPPPHVLRSWQGLDLAQLNQEVSRFYGG